jgi:hypothetical protein
MDSSKSWALPNADDGSDDDDSPALMAAEQLEQQKWIPVPNAFRPYEGRRLGVARSRDNPVRLTHFVSLHAPQLNFVSCSLVFKVALLNCYRLNFVSTLERIRALCDSKVSVSS